MTKEIAELLKKRAAAVAGARTIVDGAAAAGRDITAEESARFDKFMEEAKGHEAAIDRHKRLEQAEKWGDDLEARKADAIDREQDETRDDDERDEGWDKHPGEIGDYVRRRAVRAGVWDALRSRPHRRRKRKTEAQKRERAAFRKYLGAAQLSGEELRALQVDSSTAGGFLVAPSEFIAELIQAVDDETFIRRIARVIPLTTSDSLGAPALDADPSDPDWTGEITAVSEDTAMAIGRRQLTPHPLSKLVKVSNKLIRQSAIPVEALVTERLAYKFAIAQEKGYLTGTGSRQPLGVFVASTQGISTSRDVSSGNTSTSIQFDGLINAKYTLKMQYWGTAAWIFHRDALKQISKLKDSEGRYIWQPTVIVGQPDSLLGLPFFASEYAPNTFTTGQYVGIVGDFRNYWIAESLVFSVQRLIERYAETNQTGFIARAELDGMPVQEDAFVRVKLV